MKQLKVEYFEEEQDFKKWLSKNIENKVYALVNHGLTLDTDPKAWSESQDLYIQLIQEQEVNTSSSSTMALFAMYISKSQANDKSQQILEIKVFTNGEIIEENLLDAYKSTNKIKALVHCNQFEPFSTTICYDNQAHLVVSCPGYFDGFARCNDEPREWHCARCHEQMVYR